MTSHGVPRVAAVEPSEQSQAKELRKIEAYKALIDKVQTKIRAHEFTAETLACTSQLLSQNPEYYTIWNDRRLILKDAFAKELAAPISDVPETEGAPQPASKPSLPPAQHEILLLIQEDLAFLLPLLKNWPKCYWIWNHRAWLLQQASENLPAASALRLWQGELGLVGKMLSYDSRNFHGWTYRRRVVREMEDLSLKEAQEMRNTQAHEEQTQPLTPANTSMTEQEFEYTTKMIKTNLSNFSAWHNRSQLIPKLLRERNADSAARRKLLDQEFDLITQALYTDPYDQSLWFYHRYLMATLSPKTSESLAIVLDLTNHDRLEYLDVQIDSLKDMLDGADDCKWIYQALLTYTSECFDIEAGNKKVNTLEMRSWLEQLEKLDPLRKGRWQDLRTQLKL
ncbi:hypothetical protein MBLNU459_g7967t1 [Dothideomycetes sp. NU459]